MSRQRAVAWLALLLIVIHGDGATATFKTMEFKKIGALPYLSSASGRAHPEPCRSL